MADDLRQRILDNLMAAVFSAPEIYGVVDDLPPPNVAEPPIQPRPGYGIAERPFAYIVDGPEQLGGTDEPVNMYDVSLPIEIVIIYDYTRDDADNGPKRKGRRLLGRVQRAIMEGGIDGPNRGGPAYTTIEDSNDVGETDAEGIGLAVWRGRIPYSRNRLDPASQDSAAA